MRVAAVDCGTNSLRLLVTDLDGAQQSDVVREMRIVRLGQGVDRTGVLAPEALARAGAALADYARTCAELGVEAVRVVATSATRDARNGADFDALVRAALGVPAEVVTGKQEAALSFAGAVRGLAPQEGPFLVVDLGGGSTEFVLGTGHVEAALSVDVGCVRLTERFLSDDPPTPEQVDAARAAVREALGRVRAAVPTGRARTAVGLAGTVTTVAALALGLPAYDPQAIHLSRLRAEQVREVTARLLALPRAERAALPAMHPGRVDVIGAGAVVLDEVVAGLGLPEVLVSEADILDGVAWSARSRSATRAPAG